MYLRIHNLRYRRREMKIDSTQDLLQAMTEEAERHERIAEALRESAKLLGKELSQDATPTVVPSPAGGSAVATPAKRAAPARKKKVSKKSSKRPASPFTAKERVGRLLKKQGPLKMVQIAKALQLPRNSVSAILSDNFKKAGDHKWKA
jgi:hypothetical protein